MNKFNTGHLFFIICGVTIISMKTYPTIYIALGGRDSWISVLLSGVLLFIFAYSIFSICKRNNNFDMYDIYCSALGRPLGTFFIFIFLLTLFLTLIECTSVEANSMHVNMQFFTPPWFFLFFFIVPAIYTITRGQTAIIIVTIIGIILVTISGINLAILTAKYKHLEYLLPIMSKGFTHDFIISIIKSLAYFSGFSIIIPLLNKFENKNSIWKCIFWTLLFILQMEIVSTIGVISTFGIARLSPIYYPKLIQTQLINYFQFLESGELYVLLQMLGGWYIKYIITFFSLLTLLKQLKIERKFSVFIISLLVGICSYFCSIDTFVMFKLLSVYLDIILVNFLILPLIIFLIYDLKNKSHENNQ